MLILKIWEQKRTLKCIKRNKKKIQIASRYYSGLSALRPLKEQLEQMNELVGENFRLKINKGMRKMSLSNGQEKTDSPYIKIGTDPVVPVKASVGKQDCY